VATARDPPPGPARRRVPRRERAGHVRRGLDDPRALLRPGLDRDRRRRRELRSARLPRARRRAVKRTRGGVAGCSTGGPAGHLAGWARGALRDLPFGALAPSCVTSVGPARSRVGVWQRFATNWAIVSEKRTGLWGHCEGPANAMAHFVANRCHTRK